MISPRSDRTKYLALAEDLKRRIESGELRVGALLPSETELMRENGMARMTVRAAIKHLRVQGLVETVQGRGTSVRERRPVRRWGASRYLADADPHGSATSSTSAQRINADDFTLERDYQVVAADERHAELLDLDEGAEVLERHFVFRSKGAATELTTSCYPYQLVKGSRVADPINEPWPGGNIAQLRTLGVHVTRITEQIACRRPAPEEADVLKLGPDDHVLTIMRRMYADDRPVEFADIVMPAEDVEMDYETTIPHPD